MTVPQMFNTISKKYDFINKVLSLGLDSYWRKSLCQFLPSKTRIKLLDCATGTGDQLVTLLKNCPSIYDAVGIDPAQEMLQVAHEKIGAYSHCCRVQVASAEEIPFPDEMFDVVTISFGIRNVANLKKSLSEIYRILSPQGKIIILEFSHPNNQLIRKFHRFYLHKVVPLIGKRLSRHPHAYDYLAHTIETFPQGENFCKVLKEIGFTEIQLKPLNFGIVSIYVGVKNK